MHDGELEAELDPLCKVVYFERLVRSLGLSLLEVDSDLCMGRDARRWQEVEICSSVTVGKCGKEYVSCDGFDALPYWNYLEIFLD